MERIQLEKSSKLAGLDSMVLCASRFSAGGLSRHENRMALCKVMLTALIWMLFLVSPPSGSSQTVLRIAYPTFPPFHWLDENGRMTGFFFQIVQEALEKRMGLKVIWTPYPWIRCQDNVQAGKEDAVITVPTAERAAYTVTHKDPLYLKSLNVFTYVGHPRLEKIKGLRGLGDLKEGGFSVITYSGNGWHKENIESLGIKTHETSYLENIWKMLADKRGDVAIEWPPGAWPDIRRVGAVGEIVDTGVTISSMPFHLLVRKGHPCADMLDRFNETVKAMKQDGSMDAILSTYF
jgi:polar amino acid transport system substrate-binding protein